MKKNILVWVGLLVMGTLLLTSLFYLTGRVCRFEVWKRLFGEGRRAQLFALLLLLTVLGALAVTLGNVNAIVCFAQTVAIWLLCDAVAWVIARVSGAALAPNRMGIVAIALTLLWLSFGWYNAHHVCRTAYALSGRVSEPLRIVGFSDSHVGAVFSGEKLGQYVERINAENPDAVVIVGDFVDDDTSRTDMENACKALSGLQAKYGVYYVFGNHDSGYYSSHRGYGRDVLLKQLRANGVCVLEDENVRLCGNVWLSGRKDAHSERKPAPVLTEGLSEDDYIIMLDHQPTDYDAEMAAGADLVFSGHTHGGQLIPIRRLIKVLGKNQRLYGHEKRGNTDFIVSSGIGDWAMDFRTGCISEYFVADITPD